MPSRKLLLCLAAFALSIWSTAAQPPRTLEVVILVGQSNMEGRGDPGQLPKDIPAEPGQVWHYNDGWKPAVSSLSGQSVGPALPLADHLLRISPERHVGILTCTNGGTEIGLWMPGGELFEACVERIRAVRSRVKIMAVAYYQGESDAVSAEAVAAWPDQFERLKAALLAETGPVQFILVVLGNLARETHPFLHWAEMQAAQRSIKNVQHIEASDFPLGPDGLHLGTAGQVALGRALAEAINNAQPR
jgi:lysophospholipase L1-like esterase